MYLHRPPTGDPTVVQSPSPSSGLYIRTRGGALTKVSIPADCLAFQTGEALELATAGRLRATPHCVRVGAAPGVDAEHISRETFALFMQPEYPLSFLIGSLSPPKMKSMLGHSVATSWTIRSVADRYAGSLWMKTLSSFWRMPWRTSKTSFALVLISES